MSGASGRGSGARATRERRWWSWRWAPRSGTPARPGAWRTAPAGTWPWAIGSPAALPDGALVLTDTDDHTFPLWGRIYGSEPPGQGPVLVDRLMFQAPKKRWYRDFLRRRHPQVHWPSEEQALQEERSWEAWLLEHNPERRGFAVLSEPWSEPGRVPVHRGWHHELVAPSKRPDSAREHDLVARAYVARVARPGSPPEVRASGRGSSEGGAAGLCRRVVRARAARAALDVRRAGRVRAALPAPPDAPGGAHQLGDPAGEDAAPR